MHWEAADDSQDESATIAGGAEANAHRRVRDGRRHHQRVLHPIRHQMSESEIEDLKNELIDFRWISKELAKALGCGCTIGGDFDLCMDCADTQKAYKTLLKTYEPKYEQDSKNRRCR
jgi:hypothetical protein